MLVAWRHLVPLLLAGFLLLTLTEAIVNGGQGQWLMVAILALLLAANLRRRPRAGP